MSTKILSHLADFVCGEGVGGEGLSEFLKKENLWQFFFQVMLKFVKSSEKLQNSKIISISADIYIN